MLKDDELRMCDWGLERFEKDRDDGIFDLKQQIKDI